jgi:hypothetical protein
MRWSWLYSPAVSLGGLIASFLAIAQWAVAVLRSMYRMTEGNARRRRMCMLTAVVSFAAVGLIAPLTWTAVLAVAREGGDPGVLSILYGLVLYSSALLAAWVLLDEARTGRRFCLGACSLLVVMLGAAVVMYIASDPQPGPARYAVAVVPGLVLAMLVPVVLGQAAGHAPSAHSTSR